MNHKLQFYCTLTSCHFQVKNETATELKKKYKKVSKDEAMSHWNQQFDSSAVRCSHAYW